MGKLRNKVIKPLKVIRNGLKWRFDMRFRRDLLLSKIVWGGGVSLGEDISVKCRQFLSVEELNNKVALHKIENDLIKSYYKYEASPLEYFSFGFRESNSKRRGEFLTAIHKDRMMLKKVGKGDMYYLLKDQSLFYEKFKAFFCRDICVIKTEEDEEAFLYFRTKHTKFIAKQLKNSSVRGVELINLENCKDSSETLFNRLLSSGGCICEELIIQHEFFRILNPTSFNTVRITSFINKNGFHILKPLMKMGRPSSFVYNASSGCIVALIDEKTGTVISEGISIYGGRYEHHPDSGVRIKGHQIPYWDDLLQKVEQVHRTIEYYPYVGWDFVLSENGTWVLFEGNWGMMGSEYIDKEGIKKKFDSMFD